METGAIGLRWSLRVLSDFSFTAGRQGEMFVYKVAWLKEVCSGKMKRRERESVRIVIMI